MKLNQAGSFDVDTLSTGALLQERKQVPCQQSARGAFLMLSRPWSAKRQTEITHSRTEEQLRAPRLLREEQTSLPRLEVPAQNLFI